MHANVPESEIDMLEALILSDTASAGSDTEQERRYRNRILSKIAKREMKYGTHPDLLSYKAKFHYDPRESLAASREAFALYSQVYDLEMMTWEACAIAEICIEELDDYQQCEEWLARLSSLLSRSHSEYEARQLEEMRNRLSRCPPD